MQCLEREEFDAAWLMQRHPPRFALERKRMLLERITQPIAGTLTVSRWHGDLPPTAAPRGDPQLELVDRHFAYPPDEPGTAHWHMNFADAELFVAYGSSLLAQDELQVLEHPVLGSLREALVARDGRPDGVAPRTREAGRPTQVLVRGAIRSLILETGDGLYGNGFARADPDRILAATTFLDPPTRSNIVAMEAPPGGSGRYDRETIADILLTACIGFEACRIESVPAAATVHAGGWGTGAYGGDPVLMALLQLAAARLVGIDRLVFHSLRGPGAFTDARRILDELPWGADVPIDAFIGAIEARGFRWGLSNGT